MAPPPVPPSSKKAKRSRKGTVVSLQQFLASDSNATPRNTHVLKKLRNPYDEESDESVGKATVYELPTVPLCERKFDGKEPSRKYDSSGRWASGTDTVSNWREGQKSLTDAEMRATGAIRKQFKPKDRQPARDDDADQSSWRSPTSPVDERPKLKLQPRSLPMPAIVRLPEVMRPPKEYLLPEAKNTKITIKKRLVDENDRDGVPCNDPEAVNDRMEAAAESIQRMQVYNKKKRKKDILTENWRRRNEASGKDEDASSTTTTTTTTSDSSSGDETKEDDKQNLAKSLFKMRLREIDPSPNDSSDA